MPAKKFVAPSWDMIYDMLLELCCKIRDSGFQPDLIVGVSRGGWPPARIMSDLLDNPNLANIRVEFYTDIGVRSKKPRITQPVSVNVRGRRILVVDDVADSGLSLRAVKKSLESKGALVVRACTIYYKPQSVFLPDYFSQQTTSWVIFPWERLETIRLLSRKLRKRRGELVNALGKELKDSGLERSLVRRLVEIEQCSPLSN